MIQYIAYSTQENVIREMCPTNMSYDKKYLLHRLPSTPTILWKMYRSIRKETDTMGYYIASPLMKEVKKISKGKDVR